MHRKKPCFCMLQIWIVQEIYFTLAAENERANFQATVRVLDDCFVPKANILFERHLFWQIVQENGETSDQFICRLCQQAINYFQNN